MDDISVKFANLERGDPAPWFKQKSPFNPEFRFDTVGGRYIIMAFVPSSLSPHARQALDVIQSRRHIFDDNNLAFFGVTIDSEDETNQRLANDIPGIRFFYDSDGSVSRLYGALPLKIPVDSKTIVFRPLWIVLDRFMRVLANIPFDESGHHIQQIQTLIDQLPFLQRRPEVDTPAPVLILPHIFPLDLCHHLISLYEADGGYDSGFMNQDKDKTVSVIDYSHKRRRDYEIQDSQLIAQLNELVARRLVPQIAKSFQFHVTHIERHIVACYSSQDGGHFNAHRDNTTVGTAHRRFAVTINLNNEFEGGELRFPEFGKQTYRAPLGGAVVFSCSLLHEATTVTRGVRYAFLPFLHDREAQEIRLKNQSSIVSSKPK